jgi:hypothetical protein
MREPKYRIDKHICAGLERSIAMKMTDILDLLRDPRNDGHLNAAAAAEIERLRAIVDQLPKTADGVPMLPGSKVWTWLGQNRAVREIDITYVRPKGVYKHCYSSREAAEAAKGGDV